MRSKVVKVVCMKWGDAYDPKHVNVLHRDVKKHLSVPHDFYLIGDSDNSIDSGIKFIKLDSLGIPPEKYNDGIFPKLVLYKRDLFSDGDIVLFLDLDVLVCGDLDKFVQRVRDHRGLHLLARHISGLWRFVPQRWCRDRGGNTTVVGFIANENCNLYDTFVDDPKKSLSAFKNDQDYVSANAKIKHYWPRGWCTLFRRSLLWPNPINIFVRSAKRPTCSLVNFGGYPKFEQLLEHGTLEFGRGWKKKRLITPVEWVAEQWQE